MAKNILDNKEPILSANIVFSLPVELFVLKQPVSQQIWRPVLRSLTQYFSCFTDKINQNLFAYFYVIYDKKFFKMQSFFCSHSTLWFALCEFYVIIMIDMYSLIGFTRLIGFKKPNLV